MRLFSLALRLMRRQWRLNLIILAALLMASTLLASLPMYAAYISGDNLTQTIANTFPTNRHLEVSPSFSARQLNEQDEVAIETQLGDLILRRVVWRDQVFALRQQIGRSDSDDERRVNEWFNLRTWSLSDYEQDVVVVTGRLPSPTYSINDAGIPLVEAAIGSDAALPLALTVGDVVQTGDDSLHVHIVGIIEPVEARGDIWWGDADLIPFNIERTAGPNDTDRITLSAIVDPAISDALLTPNERWRYLLDADAITISTASGAKESLRNLTATLAATDLRATSGLPNLIENYEANLAQARVALVLLTLQSLLAVLYVLATISSFLLSQAQHELSALAGRGYSPSQITLLYAIQTTILGFGIAAPVGPFLALALFLIWSRISDVAVLTSLPATSWALALGAIGFGWLAIVLPVYLTTRNSITAWIQQRHREQTGFTWRQLTFDAIFLGLGALVYWQLLRNGSLGELDATSDIAAVDPILLLGPSLLLIAVGLLFLRLFPFALQAAAWMARRVRSFVLPASFTRLARQPEGASRVLLLVSLTAGLIVFAVVFENSLTARQAEIATYQSGADIRVTQPLKAALAEVDGETLIARSEVERASSALRTEAVFGTQSTVRIPLLAIEPDSISGVSSFPPDSPFSMDSIAAALRPREGDTLLSVVKSASAQPTGAQLNDVVTYRIGTAEVDVLIRGILVDFPTMRGAFLLTDLDQLANEVDLDGTEFLVIARRELWMSVDDEAHDAFAAELRQQPPATLGATERASRVIADSQFRLRNFQANLIGRQTVFAFRLNAIVLVILSCGGFLMVQYFSARQRATELGVLRALGLSARQLFRLLSIEGAILITLGLTVGSGLGLLLAVIMRPFLSLTLMATVGGAAVDRLVIPAGTLLTLLVSLILFYAFALSLLLASLSRSDIQRTLRIGDE